MKNDECVIAIASRIEYIEKDDRLFIVFEVKDPKMKKRIKSDWSEDLEFRILDKNLVYHES